ncbi:MAG: hypothetical protein QM778_12065 [Myxococcales bacterium]
MSLSESRLSLFASKLVAARWAVAALSISTLFVAPESLAQDPQPGEHDAPASVLVDAPAGAILPALPGPFAVGTQTTEWVDEHRADPFAPSPERRRVIAQLWYPALSTFHHPRAEYVEEAVGAFYDANLSLREGTLASLPTRAHVNAPPLYHAGGWPVVLFSTGLGVNHHLYTVLLEGLASEGFVVVALDHPYDAAVIELADGTVIQAPAPPTTQEEALAFVEERLQARVADVAFVLAQLPRLNDRLWHVMNLKRVGMFGHSLGGATAILSMLQDTRIAACVNMDGTVFDFSAQAGTSGRPLMLMSAEGHDMTNDPTWADLWSSMNGPRWELRLAQSAHLTYSDLAPLVEILDLARVLPPEVIAAYVGTVNGPRASSVQLAYLTAFFRETLTHRPSPLLRGPSSRYPEMQWLASSDVER